MTAIQILKVLYAPHKAFREIMQNPKYLGPVLIMILFIAANLGFTYVAISRTYVEQMFPDGSNGDEWTENSTLWTSNAVIAQNSDHVNGSYYGNVSIAFSITNSSQVWAQIRSVGPINCRGQDEFGELSFRTKWTSPAASPGNVTIYLFSEGSSDYFYSSLTANFSNAPPNIWNNLTIPLDTESWSRTGASADWTRITGLKIELNWLADSNITLFVDTLFFHGAYKSGQEIVGAAYYLSYAISYVMRFAITWVFLSGLIFVIARSLGKKPVWKTLLILIGFTLMTLVVQTILVTATYLAIPAVRYPFQYFGGTPEEINTATDTVLAQVGLIPQIGVYIQLVVWAWIVGLSSLAVRLLTQFSWIKSILVGFAAYFITLLAESFLLGI